MREYVERFLSCCWILLTIFSFAFAAAAIKCGYIAVAVLAGGIGILLVWPLLPHPKKRKQEEEARRRRIVARFNASPLAAQIVQDFRRRNWKDLDRERGGCQIYFDKIVTPCQRYIYIDYGYEKLNLEGCKELAEYLGMAYGNSYSINKIVYHGGGSNVYSISPRPNGNFSIYRDGDLSDGVPEGYSLYSNTVTPSGKSW